jgi:vacuolar protein sorting-associated protein 13A/C
MSFGRMDKPAERVRFLDDLNVALSVDAGRPGRASDQKTTIDLDLPSAVIFRASYSDILLITDVVNKAIAVASQSLQPTQPAHPTTVDDHASTSVTGRRTSITTGGASLETPRAAPSARRRSSVSRRRPSSARTSVIVSKQEVRFVRRLCTDASAQCSCWRLPIRACRRST